MKCPHCGTLIAAPFGWTAYILGAEVIIITCPACQAVLGAVNKQQGQ